MRTKEIISNVCFRTGLDSEQASFIVNRIFEVIRETLVSGDEVRIDGFGSFTVRQHSERNGINPHTRKPMKCPAYNDVRFKAYHGLKEKLN